MSNTTGVYADELFARAPIHKAFFALALPNVCGKIVLLVYSVADTWFISQIGSVSLVAGVSLCAPVLLIMGALGDTFGQGGASVITRLFGGREHDSVKRLSSFCFWTALICGCILSAVLLAVKTPLLYLIGADESTITYASQYYSWLVLAAPFSAITSVPLNILRTEGLARQSMMGNIVGSVVNLILDPIFIFGLNMGAAGAAIATLLGYVSSALYFVWIYLHRCQVLSIRPKLCRVSGKEVSNVLAIGIPSCLIGLTQSFGAALINRFLLVYGSDKIAAYGIAGKISMITMLALAGFAFGSLSLVGYNYGAGDYIRLRKILRFIYTFELSLAAIMIVLCWCMAPFLMGCFLDDAGVISAGITMVRCLLVGQIFTAFTLVTICVFQATGQAFGALMISANRQGVLFVFVLTGMTAVFGYFGLLYTQAVCDFICSLIGVVFLVRLLRSLTK